MRIDTIAPPVPRAPRARRTIADRLRSALADLGGHHGQIVSHTETPWASITFAGTRHTVAMLFCGPDAVEAGEQVIAALPEHEFAIPGQLVADATVVEVDHRLLPTPRLALRCDLLLLEEG